MGILSGNPKNEPLHYGEVFGTWLFVSVEQGLIPAYQTFLNHTGDEDLKKLIVEWVEQCRNDLETVKEILKENGIGLPPSPPERSDACLEDIPVGARFQDPEIAAMLSREVTAGLVSCSSLIGQCIREDLALIYSQIHAKKLAFGAKMLRLTKEKGWLIPPPLHLKSENC